MIDKILNNAVIVVPLCMAILLWLVVSFKCGILFFGLYSFGIYAHITITTLSNALVGREINVTSDFFWKIVFLLMGCLCLSVFFAV